MNRSLGPLSRFIVVLVAAIGFLFDTYELLMFPVIGEEALRELLHLGNEPAAQATITLWSGRMLWIAALCGGIFGLLGGWLVDRLGRRTVMIGSILLYSLSPVGAAISTELWQFIVCRCLTFVGVCVELVAAVTWLAELFSDRKTRESVIGWTLAAASLGGILVTEVSNQVQLHREELPPWFPVSTELGFSRNAPWRFILLTGLIPGALILLLIPFVPESEVWRAKRREGKIRRQGFGTLFTSDFLRTTITTSLLSASAYAAAFGAIQLTPLVIYRALPHMKAKSAEVAEVTKKLETLPEDSANRQELELEKKKLVEEEKTVAKRTRGQLQRMQELGGLLGRILLAILVLFVPSRMLLRFFLIPGLVLFPMTYVVLLHEDFTLFTGAIFLCGLVTVAQFSYLSDYLPKLYPVALRGTGAGFATNVGGRMLGTMAATLNTEFLSKSCGGVANAAAIIGGTVFFLALVLSFFLPDPKAEAE